MNGLKKKEIKEHFSGLGNMALLREFDSHKYTLETIKQMKEKTDIRNIVDMIHDREEVMEMLRGELLKRLEK